MLKIKINLMKHQILYVCIVFFKNNRKIIDKITKTNK
jgi:hypothetical protein